VYLVQFVTIDIWMWEECVAHSCIVWWGIHCYDVWRFTSNETYIFCLDSCKIHWFA